MSDKQIVMWTGGKNKQTAVLAVKLSGRSSMQVYSLYYLLKTQQSSLISVGEGKGGKMWLTKFNLLSREKKNLQNDSLFSHSNTCF